MISNRLIPRCTVIPELAYPDVGQAAEWLCRAFGFTLRLGIGNHRAQLNVGDCAVVVTEQSQTGVPARSSVMVRVEDADSHYARACQSGARVVQPPADYPYGERQYVVEDPAGHRWCFSQSIADVDPADWGGTVGQL